MAKYHLQIGYAGMKYHDATLDDTEPRENAKVLFGTDDIATQVTYDAGLCDIDGICLQRQLTYDHDLPDLTIQAVPPPPGDFGRDGMVGPEDYFHWRSTFGKPVAIGAEADGNGNGKVDAADYVMWRDHQTVFPGDYDRNGSVGTEDYTLWKQSFGQPVVIGTGADGNGNGIIDAADYVMWRDIHTSVLIAHEYDVWRQAFGQPAIPPGSGADYNQNGIVDAADYVVWRDRTGMSAGGGATIGGGSTSIARVSAPEPSSSMLSIGFLFLVCTRRFLRPAILRSSKAQVL
jgi:hypothetical protein